MAERDADDAPRVKKQKRSTASLRINAKQSEKQFKDDLYADDEVLFCKFCDHSLDFVRVDTINNVERSFSQYKHLLNDRRESLTEENMKSLLTFYYNGDLEARFDPKV